MLHSCPGAEISRKFQRIIVQVDSIAVLLSWNSMPMKSLKPVGSRWTINSDFGYFTFYVKFTFIAETFAFCLPLSEFKSDLVLK